MNHLPEPPAASATGQATNPLTDAVISAAVDHAIEKAKQHETTPQVLIGTTAPVVQPGRPPMSQSATDASVLMLAGGAATSMVGLTTAVVMYVSQYADPVVCAIVFGAPTAGVLALGRLAKRAKGVLPTEHHHHYNGPVDQRHVHTENRSVWARTDNRR